jgi:hypothetical protein
MSPMWSNSLDRKRTPKSTTTDLKFRCCYDGKIELPPINDTPQELIRTLLSETYVNRNGETVFTQRTQDFQRLIRAYNNAVAFKYLSWYKYRPQNHEQRSQCILSSHSRGNVPSTGSSGSTG